MLIAVDIGMGIVSTTVTKISILKLLYNYIKDKNFRGKMFADFAGFGQERKFEFPFISKITEMQKLIPSKFLKTSKKQ